MIGQQLSIPVAGSMMPAYLARPEEGSGPHPAVVVLPEIFGHTAEIQRITDLVASAGYVGLAINYYHRTHPALHEPYSEDGIRNGLAAASQVTRETLRTDVSAATGWLTQQDFVKDGKVATWGFCFGGTAAFVTATLPGLRGAICFYGSAIARPLPSGEPEGLTDAASIACPLLLCFGAQDESLPPAAIERIRSELALAGVEAHIQTYDHVGHAFFRHGTAEALESQQGHSDEATAEAVADAWGLVQASLKNWFQASADEISGSRMLRR